jgi:hypothetical protein
MGTKPEGGEPAAGRRPDVAEEARELSQLAGITLGPREATLLIEQLTRIADNQETQLNQNRSTAPLNPAQRRIALHYGALRNALGNFGRHGDANTALLSPAPRLEEIGPRSVLVFDAAIERAARVATYAADGTSRGTFAFPSDLRLHVGAGAPIRTVEIEDDQGTPFLLGIVQPASPYDGVRRANDD